METPMPNNAIYRLKDVGQTVTAQGFVAKVRDLGHLVFVDLRDRSGLLQLSFDADHPLKEEASQLKNESVIEVTGVLKERSNKNKEIPTGDIELLVKTLTVLSMAKTPPLMIQDDTDALEETRLKYRYLDLRRPVLQNLIRLRHDIMQATREYLNQADFLEIETPILNKSTPEGARDYVVPSRIYPDHFYALPQSPQMYKQLLMISGFEKYYQVAKCFRDEDLRRDRQPEFTQIDIEMAFAKEKDVMALAEGLVKHVFKKANQAFSDRPFDVLTYHQAMEVYGSDKPDRRFGLPLIECTELFKNNALPLFKGKKVKAILVKEGAEKITRKLSDTWAEMINVYPGTTLLVLKKEETLTGSIVKNLAGDEIKGLMALGLETGDALMVVMAPDVYGPAGRLRLLMGEHFKLIDAATHDAFFVVDWPLYDYDHDAKRYVSMHHPFTAPKTLESLKDPSQALASAYDLVIDGHEVGGGSIRIHQKEVQETVFRHLGMDEKMIEEQFGFFVKAFDYGTPPHGGIAFGLDRLVMILGKTDNIRDVIAFPKTSSGQCLMSEAPGQISDHQKKELSLK
jgi:aspartyl-tRNA synthetase